MTPARGSVHLVVGTDAPAMAATLSETIGPDASVETATDTDAVLDRLAETAVRSVVVCDGDGYDGLAAFEAFRAVAPTVPIVLVATDPAPDRVNAGLRAGVTDYVSRDSAPSLLAAKLDAYATRWPTDWRAGTELWDDISSGVSHDAKNPLNVVTGRFELLDIEAPHEEPLMRSVNRVETLLTDLSEIGSIARPVTEPETLSLADVAAEAWPSGGYETGTLNVATTATVEAESDRLRLLLAELFENAVTHSEGPVTVTVGDTDTGFYVADDGPGIPESDRDEVFEQGFGTARDGEGYGLFLVDVAARAHGWTVSVGDSDSGGTRVDVTTAG